jgi:hypothetical protein
LLAPPATALGRVGVPDDIGPVIASLVSDDNHWVTGQRIEASGGIAVASLIERFPDATSDILSAWTGVWWRDIANGERLDNKRGSHEMFQTARHSPEFQCRRNARGHTTKALSSFAGSLKPRRLFFHEIVRDVGEQDAVVERTAVVTSRSRRPMTLLVAIQVWPHE